MADGKYVSTLSGPELDAALREVLAVKTTVRAELQVAKDSGEFNGKSAYAYAQDGGFIGTEKEFADRLATNPDWVPTKVAYGGDALVISEQTLTSGIWSKLQMLLQPGIIYAVIFNGEKYVCEARADGSGVELGNNTSLTLNDYPFCIKWAGGSATSGMFFKRSDISYPVTLKVTEHSGYVYNKMPEEYLPDGVVKSVNGKEPDANGNVDSSAPTDEQVESAVSEWLEEHPEATTTVQDGSISEEKLTAEVRAKLNSSQNANGLNGTSRTLLINILRSAVFANDQSANITALESALSSGADSGGSGGGSAADYAVICNLTNVKSSNISAGILHGNSYITTLTADEGYILSNVTVTMSGEDVTPSVYSNGVITIASVTGDVVITATAVADVGNLVANWDFTNGSLVDSVGGLEATMSDTTMQDSTGVKILSESDYLIFPTANMAGKRVEVKFGAMEFYATPTSKHGRLYTWCVKNSTNFGSGFYWRKDGFWAVSSTPTGFTDINMFANNTLVVEYDADTKAYYYFDGQLIATQTPGKTLERSCISTPSGTDPFYNVTVESIKIYDALIYTAVS